MNIRTSAFRGVAILSLTALGMAACEDKDVINIPEPEPPAVEVTVAPTQVSIPVGGTAAAAAVVKNSTNQAVTWACAPAGVVNISAAGIITAVAPGSAICTATAAADATAKGLVSVTVTAPVVTLSVLPTTATISKTAPGNTIQLSATVSGTTNQNVTWQSNATGVATVSATGLVTAVAPGTAVITATSAADTNVRASSVVTVSSGPTVTIALVPAQASTVVGGTVQLQASVPATFRTSDATIATVSASGLVTGVKQGTAVITAVAVADTTAKATAVVTVQGASVAIAVVPEGVQAGPGAFIIQTNVAIPAGSADSLMMRLTNLADTTKVYQWRCQTFTAAGAATQVHCPINPADFDPFTAGVQVLPNGTYRLQAVLIKANIVADIATWGTPVVTNYGNTVAGTIAIPADWDNTLNDTDNDPATTPVIVGGTVWHGGSVTLHLAASVFTGSPITTIPVSVVPNCVVGNEAALITKNATIAANGTGAVTFSEANLTATEIDALSNTNVCFRLGVPTDAQGLAVSLAPVGAGTGAVISAGTVLVSAPGAGQNVFQVDNVEPAAFVPVLPVSITDNNNYAGLNTTFSSTLVTGLPTDAGVGGITYKFYAVPSANVTGTTQANLLAYTTSTGAVLVTSASQLPESTVDNAAYRLVVEAKDALGNVAYGIAAVAFGVDLTVPTIAAQSASAANNSTNPTAELYYNITDTFSGPRVIRVRQTRYSVLEVDTNADTDIQCLDGNGAVTSTNPSSGVCPTFDHAVVDVQFNTTDTANILLPNVASPPPAPPISDEGYIVTVVWSVDRAGNVSPDSVSRTVLMDVTAPTGTIDQYTVITATNSISMNATINENVDLASYDVRYNFPLTTIPTQVPFTTPTAVDSYGLPLTGVVAVTGQNAENIREITEATGTRTPDAVGFGARDVAGNFGFVSQALAFGGGNGVGLTVNDAGGLNTFDLDVSGTIDRSSAPNQTLNAIVMVGPTDLNPINRVYFYLVNPGVDGLYDAAPGGDDYLVLLGIDTTADPFTGVLERTFTFQLAITAANFPANGTWRVVALAVDPQGDALLSDLPTVTVID